MTLQFIPDDEFDQYPLIAWNVPVFIICKNLVRIYDKFELKIRTQLELDNGIVINKIPVDGIFFGRNSRVPDSKTLYLEYDKNLVQPNNFYNNTCEIRIILNSGKEQNKDSEIQLTELLLDIWANILLKIKDKSDLGYYKELFIGWPANYPINTNDNNLNLQNEKFLRRLYSKIAIRIKDILILPENQDSQQEFGTSSGMRVGMTVESAQRQDM